MSSKRKVEIWQYLQTGFCMRLLSSYGRHPSMVHDLSINPVIADCPKDQASKMSESLAREMEHLYDTVCVEKSRQHPRLLFVDESVWRIVLDSIFLKQLLFVFYRFFKSDFLHQ
ncbi:hypothetical protein O6H91_11G099800 [Diphasiastrum complanatum]|uniref:Uncharacterized protein n=1 Tax=Diphasiastrum complanatum TaxID=34168 RepID=A0ACC2CC30_DIPCM|nr:hypothetical protein O6H91_11G099800 [Diphasiastrum complanatum]